MSGEDTQHLTDFERGPAPEEDLDAAWAKVEAVLPEGWSFRLHRMPSGRVTVTARNEKDWPQMSTVFHDRPAPALRDLAELLGEP